MVNTFDILKNWLCLGVSSGLSIFCLFFSEHAFAQDPYLQKSNRAIRREAVKITAQYQPGLVMGTDQALDFTEKVAEFLIRKKAVMETDFSPGKKMYYLERLSAQETAEMVDILERFRMEEYVRLKKVIQPLPLLGIGITDSIY